MAKLETRGPEFGQCNICGLMARLTEDHIPPKGVPLVGQAYLEKLGDTLGVRRDNSARRFFQRGVKYRSICAPCNNHLLGATYDPELIALARSVHATLQERAHLPTTFEFGINCVLRSVVGHLIAHGINQYRIGSLYAALTDYFIDPAASFPSNLRMYSWIYPHRAQVVAHALGSIFDFREMQEEDNPFVFSLLKFYPLAFMCSTRDLPANEAGAVTRIDHFSSGSLGDRAQATLNISHIPRERWPESPGKNGMVFHNEFGTIAKPPSQTPGRTK